MTTRPAPLLIVLGIAAGCPVADPPGLGSLGDLSEGSTAGLDSETGMMPDQGSNTETDTGTTDETDSTTGDPDDGPFELNLSQVKQFGFSWPMVEGADFYQLYESLDGLPYVQVSNDMVGLETSLTVPLHFRLNAEYRLRACKGGDCTDSKPVNATGPLAEAIGYFKTSNSQSDDFVGYEVAMSDDGTTLVVGAPHEDSSALGVGGNQTDNSASNSGAVYVFVRDAQNEWIQQAYIKASNSDSGDNFGTCLSLSGDGNTLVVGAPREDSSSPDVQHTTDLISGTQTDNLATDSGAAYIFSRDGLGLWLQRAYVKPSVVGQGDNFGASVAISNDGFTLAVGATQEDSSSFGVAGDLNDNSLTDSGAVYLFWRDQQGMWAPQVFAKASNPGQSDYFGHRVALAADGDTLAVGAIRESSAATGVDGVQTDDSANAAGAVYVFTRNFLGKWSQQAYVKPLNTDAGDYFSSSLALSANGLTLAVGAGYEDSDATGVNGDSSNNAAIDSGAVHVFVYDGAWMQQSYLKASNTHPGDTFGTSLAISDNGATLVIGATGEDSSAIGVGGDQSDVSYDGAGAAYVFVREGQGVWLQRAYLKSSNPDMLDHFGASVSVAWDGGTVAVGSPQESSDATGIGGNANDNSAASAGAVFMY